MTWHPEIPDEYRNQIVTGDARELAKRLPDESVDLIFTDPVYDRIEDYEWLAATSARVLKPGGAALAFCGIGWLDETLAALKRGGLLFRWSLVLAHVCRRGFHAPCGFSQYTLCLWCDRDGSSRFRRQVPDMRPWQPEPYGFYQMRERWFQDPNFCAYYLEALTEPGAVVADFFCGTGTLPAVCKQFGREFIAWEIDSERAEKARARVRFSALPLFVLDAPDLQEVLAL